MVTLMIYFFKNLHNIDNCILFTDVLTSKSKVIVALYWKVDEANKGIFLMQRRIKHGLEKVGHS